MNEKKNVIANDGKDTLGLSKKNCCQNAGPLAAISGYHLTFSDGLAKIRWSGRRPALAVAASWKSDHPHPARKLT